MSTMDVRLPDGTVIRGVPEGISKAQLADKLKANGMAVPAEWMTTQDEQRAAMIRKEVLRSPPVALARGLKDIVDTGAGFLSRLGGEEEQQRVRAENAAGRAQFDEAAAGQVMPQIARIGGNIAGVAPAVTALGGAVSQVAPRLGAAIASGGMTTGAAPVGAVARLADMGVRSAGGAVGGFVGAGMVDPESAKTGAAIGAALPPVLAALGASGRAVGGVFRGKDARTAEKLAKALGVTPAQAGTVSAKLRGAQELVPGSQPTVSQVLRSPQAGTLERIVSESPGGAALKQRYLAQGAARMRALDGVAPVDPRGFRSAQNDFGIAAGDFARKTDKAMRAATSRAYEAVPQDEALLYLPDLASIRDKYFPAGSVSSREFVDKVVRMADEVGTRTAPGVAKSAPKVKAESLATAVRRVGGLSLEDSAGLRGEVAGLGGDFKNLVRKNGGVSLSRMAEKMHEAGFLPDDDTATLISALRDEATGSSVVSTLDDAFRGGQTQANTYSTKVTLRMMDALRRDIASEAREAARSPARAREAAALNEMRRALDGRVDEVIRGDGQIDEVLPLDWANKLSEARKLKTEQVGVTGTGPQEAALRRGSDGFPVVQGGELAAKVWGSRPGVAADVEQFRRLIDRSPALLGQFRSMVTTEGASTATAGGQLSSKFVRWVENTLPGLEKTFEPAQVQMLRRIAADIRRADAAAAAGAARGSPTYQNASNALSLGLLDNPLMSMAAERIPGVRAFTGPGLQALRDTARESQARALADLLANPTAAAQAVQRAMSPQDAALLRALSSPDLQRAVLRAGPVIAADR